MTLLGARPQQRRDGGEGRRGAQVAGLQQALPPQRPQQQAHACVLARRRGQRCLRPQATLISILCQNAGFWVTSTSMYVYWLAVYWLADVASAACARQATPSSVLFQDAGIWVSSSPCM